MGCSFSSHQQKFDYNLSSNQIFDYDLVIQNLDNPSFLDAVNRLVECKIYKNCPNLIYDQIQQYYGSGQVCAFYSYFFALINEKNCQFHRADQYFDFAKSMMLFSSQKLKYLDKYISIAHARCQLEI